MRRLALVLLAAAGPAFAALTEDEALKAGDAAAEKGDRAEAARLYDAAVKLAPTSAVALTRRGSWKLMGGDLDGAGADFERAIRAHPSFAQAYIDRAVVRNRRGDVEGAIADEKIAIGLQPSAAAYNNLANDLHNTGDVDGALAALKRAEELFPSMGYIYDNRGTALVAKGDFRGALKEYARGIELAKDDDASSRIFLALTRARLGDGRALAELGEEAGKWKPGWERTVADYLAGRIPEKRLRAAAGDGRDDESRMMRASADYYAGMTRLLRGDLDGARAAFQACVDSKMRAVDEINLARAELARSPSGGR